MRKVSILIPHFKSFKWIASCIHHFKTYPLSIDHELVICDNSHPHPSIRAISETSLGDNVKIVLGDPTLPSHGQGYSKCWEAASPDCDWAFTAENDSFPTRHGWFEEYVKAAGNGYDLIGPYMPMSAGRYIHPAGAVVNRKVLDAAKQWQDNHKEWWFCPGAAIKFHLDPQAYHVVAHEDLVRSRGFITDQEIINWRKAQQWQEMRSFDEDSFSSYGSRVGITNWEPVQGKYAYKKIGYEAGQWLSYFAQSHGFKVLKADLHIEWMKGREGRQAAFSTVFGGFTHIWAGSSSIGPGLDQEVRDYKNQQASYWMMALPEKLRNEVELLERSHS